MSIRVLANAATLDTCQALRAPSLTITSHQPIFRVRSLPVTSLIEKSFRCFPRCCVALMALFRKKCLTNRVGDDGIAFARIVSLEQTAHAIATG